MRVPCLESPPEVIPIDLGCQLLVDDLLIEHTTLERTFHLAQYHSKNPVLTCDRPWEQEGRAPFAAVFSDGVWFDPQDQLFKMWYSGGYLRATLTQNAAGSTSRSGMRCSWAPAATASIGIGPTGGPS
jgi:hypothetical protein